MKKAYSADWNAIKKDYLQGLSFTSLHEKYGVSLGALSDQCKTGGWKQARETIAARAEQKMVDVMADRASRISLKVTVAVEGIIDKTIDGVKSVSKTDAMKLRAYMSILKDAKDMGLYRADMDIAEQMARIKKLEKEASAEEADNTINVVISEEAREYVE